MSSKYLSSMEIDAIGEIQNISLGASATAVSTMLNARTNITTPTVSVVNRDDFEISSLDPAVCVEITYIEGLTGKNIMLLKKEDVKMIVEMLMGIEIPDNEFELNEINISAICEVMNQMMGASSTALSELLSKTINISTPTSFGVEDIDSFKDLYFEDNNPMVCIKFNLSIDGKMASEFMNLMPINLAKELVEGFFPGGLPGDDEIVEEQAKSEPAPASAPAVAEASSSTGAALSQEEINKLMGKSEEIATPAAEPAGGTLSQEEINKLMGNMAEEPVAPAASSATDGTMSQEEINKLLGEANDASAQSQMATPVQPQATSVQQATMAPPQPQVITQQAPANDMLQQMMNMMQQQMEMQQKQIAQLQKEIAETPKNIKVNQPPRPNLEGDNMEIDPDANVDLIMGVALDVSVEIGRTQKLVKDILELNRGSLVVLDKLAGEQVDVFVNGECIAKGDVVVVEDNFGVRITEILKNEISI